MCYNCNVRGHICTPIDEREMEKALTHLRTDTPQNQNFTTYIQYLQSENLKQILDPYQNQERFGGLFNSTVTQISDNDFLYFEMDYLLNNYKDDAIIPVLAYLIEYIELKQDGTPTLIILDECWKYLKNDYFRTIIGQWIKTKRKHNTAIVLATQEIDDVLGSDIAKTIITNTATQIFLPNAKADISYEGYKNSGLSDDEIEIIKNSETKKHYYIKNDVQGSLVNFNFTEEQLQMML